MIGKSKILILILIVFGFKVDVQSQTIFGTWKTVDEKTGKEKALVEIYKKNDEVYGKIVEIFDKSKRDLPCKFCEGEDKNKPLIGLDIIKGMEKVGDEYEDGTITNPENGKVYTCKMELTDDPNVLQVRGYVAFFYRTQKWERVE